MYSFGLEKKKILKEKEKEKWHLGRENSVQNFERQRISDSERSLGRAPEDEKIQTWVGRKLSIKNGPVCPREGTAHAKRGTMTRDTVSEPKKAKLECAEIVSGLKRGRAF